MNETLIFEENNKLYICERASYITGGFRYPKSGRSAKLRRAWKIQSREGQL